MVQLQDGWYGGVLNGSSNTFGHWNYPTEIAWNALGLAGGKVMHWDGLTWSDVASGTTRQLNRMSVIPVRKPSAGWRQVYR